MAVNSKQKGARFERSLASKLRDYGYQTRRTAQYCGNTGDASDVVGLPGLHIEAKHQERMQLYDWMSQAKRDSEGTGRLPAVFHKKNNADILVTLRFEDFMEIYREYASDLLLKEKESKGEV
jgi:Holliday junction resolvase